MSAPLAIVSWLWGDRTKYGPKHINVLRAMVDRHLTLPHRHFCICDDAKGLHPDITPVKIPPAILPTVSPRIFHQAGLLRARRVQLFNPDWARTFGERLFQLDIDTVITGNLDEIAARAEPVVVLDRSCQTTPSLLGPGNPSLLMFDAEALGECWRQYRDDPTRMYLAARKDGRMYADGAILGLYLNRRREPGTWGSWDLPKYGIYSYMRDLKPKPPMGHDGALPADARVVMFYGNDDPARAETRARSPWITEHWHEKGAAA